MEKIIEDLDIQISNIKESLKKEIQSFVDNYDGEIDNLYGEFIVEFLDKIAKFNNDYVHKIPEILFTSKPNVWKYYLMAYSHSKDLWEFQRDLIIEKERQMKNLKYP